MGAASASAVDGDDVAEEPDVVHEHPLLRAPGDVSLDEAMGIAHWALSQAQEGLHRGCGIVDDECQCLMLWVLLLKEWTTSEKVRAQAREQHLDMREELLEMHWAVINDLNTAS
jgi:hypothetical protein